MDFINPLSQSNPDAALGLGSGFPWWMVILAGAVFAYYNWDKIKHFFQKDSGPQPIHLSNEPDGTYLHTLASLPMLDDLLPNATDTFKTQVLREGLSICDALTRWVETLESDLQTKEKIDES